MDAELTLDGGVATICLNRPDKLNAITPEMKTLLSDYLDRIQEDPEVRAVILTGAGRGFCAGADISGTKTASPDGEAPKPALADGVMGYRIWQDLGLKFYNLDKPLIAAIRGPCVGIAWAFALGSDMIIASETAKFIPAFLLRATIPEAGFVHRLVRLCGEFRAKEIIYLNQTVTATEALDIGLVNRVVADEALTDEVNGVAQELAKMPTFSVGLTKRLFKVTGGSMEEFLSFERNSVPLATNSDDALEGRTAFKEKRPPNFKGR